MRNLCLAALAAAALSGPALAQGYGESRFQQLEPGREQLMEKARVLRAVAAHQRSARTEDGAFRMVWARSRDAALGRVRELAGEGIMAITKRDSGWTEELVRQALDRELSSSVGLLVIDNAMVSVTEENGLAGKLRALKDKGIKVFFIKY